jgi:cell division protein FtsW (lipid II flippase)
MSVHHLLQFVMYIFVYLLLKKPDLYVAVVILVIQCLRLTLSNGPNRVCILHSLT